MAEFEAGEVFTDVAPGKTLTSTRLNNHVNGTKARKEIITDKAELAANAVAVDDYVLLADASDGATDYPKKTQVQNLIPQTVRQGVQQYAAGTLSGGVYAVTLAPVATAYTEGMIVRFKADSANAGAVDINVNSVGAKNLFSRGGGELAANDILAGQIVVAVYDGTQFQVIQVLSAGEVTAIHCAEANRTSVHQYAAGIRTAGVYLVTLSPAATAYVAGMVVRFVADAANQGAVDANINGLGAKNIFKNASAELLANDILAGQIVTLVYDGTNFQMANARSGDFVSSNTALPGSGAVATIAHGLGARPTRLRAVLVRTGAAAEQSYEQNDELEISSVQESGTNTTAFAVSADATNVYVAQINNANVQVIPRAGGAYAAITEADWAIKVYASL